MLNAFLLQAQTHVFLNVNRDDNWSDNNIPNTLSTIVIPDGFEAIITVQNAFANSIELAGAAILELNNVLNLTSTLNISPVGNLKLKNGSITEEIINNQGFIRVTELPQKQLTQVIINNELDAIFKIIGRSGLLNNIGSQFNNVGLFKKSFDGASSSFS